MNWYRRAARGRSLRLGRPQPLGTNDQPGSGPAKCDNVSIAAVDNKAVAGKQCGVTEMSSVCVEDFDRRWDRPNGEHINRIRDILGWRARSGAFDSVLIMWALFQGAADGTHVVLALEQQGR